MTIAIIGAGEQAPEFHTGGYTIDLWGVRYR